MLLNTTLLQDACSSSPWDLGNEVLYSLCRAHPTHADGPAVIAKMWLIGRSYAAAIERRRDRAAGKDDFYIEVVAPQIVASPIDQWLLQLAEFSHPSVDSLPPILRTHAQVTKLFDQISGLEKRSLASKYLHFHLPHLFYIFDKRAVTAMRKLTDLVGRAHVPPEEADLEYGKFALKCLRLQDHIAEAFGITMVPRDLDKLLLRLYGNES